MNNDYLLKAIRRLKPNSEFSFTDNNYSTIKWDILDGTAPSQTEINVMIEQIKSEEINEANTKAQAKAALLAQLGITEEQAKLLLS